MNYNIPEGSHREGDAVRRTRRSRRGEQQRKPRRWGLLAVDILLLVVILAAIFFLVVLLTPFDPFGAAQTEERTVVYTVELAGLHRDAVQSLRVGDTVTDAQTGSVIGEVVNIASRSYEVYTDLPSPNAAMTDEGNHKIYIVSKKVYPEEFQTVTVTIRLTADYESGVGYWADDCRIAVGRSYSLRFPAFAGDGVCVTFAEE